MLGSVAAGAGTECAPAAPVRPLSDRQLSLVRLLRGLRLRAAPVDLRRSLKLTPVANRLAPNAAQVIAGRLARENIPCYVGGWHTFGGVWGSGSIGLDSITTLKETSEPGEMIAVPASLFGKAMRILNQPPIPEAELADLALRTAPD